MGNEENTTAIYALDAINGVTYIGRVSEPIVEIKGHSGRLTLEDYVIVPTMELIDVKDPSNYIHEARKLGLETKELIKGPTIIEHIVAANMVGFPMPKEKHST